MNLAKTAVAPGGGRIDFRSRSDTRTKFDDAVPVERDRPLISARERLAYSVANTAAVLASLFIAFWLDLDRPYWAMFSVFIVAKPISGAVRAKSVYRLTGTLLGASMAVFLVPPLVQSPVLLSVATSLWIGICLFAALQDRAPRSYVFLLAAYSVAIVGLPTVNDPTSIFDVAVSRVEEISIGIICASVAHSVFFPRSLADVLRAKAKAAVRHSAKVTANAIKPNSTAPSAADIAMAGAFVTDLHTLYSQIGFETSNVPRLPGVMAALLDRLATILPTASLIQRSIVFLERRHQLTESLRAFLEDASFSAIHDVSAPGRETSSAMVLHRQPVSRETGTPELHSIRKLVFCRTRDVLCALAECRELAAALNDTTGRTSVPDPPVGRRPLYRDQGLALLSAFSAAAATLVACALWIAMAWPEGFVAAQFAAIVCCLFATLDNPSKVIGPAVLGVIVAVAVASLYEFAILPGIDGFVSLALVLTPALLFFSFLQTYERLEGVALVLAIGFSGAIALRDAYAADFASFINSNLAEICGALIAGAMLSVFRTIDPIWNANRILRSGRLSIGELARMRVSDHKAWALQMFDRVGLVAARLAQAPAPVAARDILHDLRIGFGISALLQCRDACGHAVREKVDEVLSLIDDLYLRNYRTAEVPISRALRSRLTALSSSLGRAPASAALTEATIALAGLRLDLDPPRRRANCWASREECAA